MKASSRRNNPRCFLAEIWYDTYGKHIRIQQKENSYKISVLGNGLVVIRDSV